MDQLSRIGRTSGATCAPGVARTMATRKAATFYAKSAGHKPQEIVDRDM